MRPTEAVKPTERRQVRHTSTPERSATTITGNKQRREPIKEERRGSPSGRRRRGQPPEKQIFKKLELLLAAIFYVLSDQWYHIAG
ncbi:hypothetical protein YC2023_093763 [Brassica napus]